MQFSVIVPIYNVEKYLNQCVDSILDQNMLTKEYEIILVDDGSEDNSGIICDEYGLKNSNIKVIHKENGGLSAARNSGIKVATGEYIIFVDSDDYIETNSLVGIAEVIHNNNEPDFVCLDCCKFYSDSDKRIGMNDGITETINSLRGEDLYRYLSNLKKYPASACTKAIKRSFLIENGLLFEVGKLSEDLEWGLRLFLSANSISYYSGSFYYYRQERKGSISNISSEKNMFHILETLEKGLELLQTISADAKYQMVACYLEYMFRLPILHYNAISFDRRNEYRRRLKNSSCVLRFRHDIASRLIRISYKVFGVKYTGILLRLYLKARTV